MQISAAITKCVISHHSFIVGKSSHPRGSNMDSYDSDFELPKKEAIWRIVDKCAIAK